MSKVQAPGSSRSIQRHLLSSTRFGLRRRKKKRDLCRFVQVIMELDEVRSSLASSMVPYIRAAKVNISLHQTDLRAPTLESGPFPCLGCCQRTGVVGRG